jgi:predicted O-methyltransferase YrrM
LLGTVQIQRARTVVECGSGVSTLVLARHFRITGDGHVYALEHDRWWYELMQEWLLERNLADYATVIYAPLERVEVDRGTFTWYSLAAAKPVLDLSRIQLLLVDGPPGVVGSLARYPALPLLRSRLAPSSVVVLDDAQRPDEQRIGRLWEEQLARRAELVEGVGSQLEWRLGSDR